MKRRAWVTVFLDVVALLAVTPPPCVALFGLEGASGSSAFASVLDLAAEQGLRLFIAVAALGQVLLLIVPIGIAERRPRSRRRLHVPVIATWLLLALLTATVGACVAVAHVGDDIDGSGPTVAVVSIGLSWIAWGVLFRRALRDDDPESRMRRVWLRDDRRGGRRLRDVDRDGRRPPDPVLRHPHRRRLRDSISRRRAPGLGRAAPAEARRGARSRRRSRGQGTFPSPGSARARSSFAGAGPRVVEQRSLGLMRRSRAGAPSGRRHRG